MTTRSIRRSEDRPSPGLDSGGRRTQDSAHGSPAFRPSLTLRPLRAHQRRLLGVVQAMAGGQTEARDILAAVTPGGGKSLLPVLAAHTLIGAGLVERVCWVVPRDSLRLQAEEAFADPTWRQALGHALSVRAADNAPDPCRGLSGYVTTYQGVAAAPDLHLREFTRHRTLLVVDEVHHLPALGEVDPVAARQAEQLGEDQASAWSAALLPLLECASVRLLLSGTLERADGRGILWLPYRTGLKARTREVELDAPGWAVIGYSRAEALRERAVLPVTFGALDGEASWQDETGTALGPHRLAGSHPEETTRPGAVHRAAHRLCRGAAAGGLRRHPRPARPAAAGARAGARGQRLRAWASCWWWLPTRRRPGATWRSCAAGFPGPRLARRRSWPPPTRRAHTRCWRRSGSGRSRRSW